MHSQQHSILSHLTVSERDLIAYVHHTYANQSPTTRQQLMLERLQLEIKDRSAEELEMYLECYIRQQYLQMKREAVCEDWTRVRQELLDYIKRSIKESNTAFNQHKDKLLDWDRWQEKRTKLKMKLDVMQKEAYERSVRELEAHERKQQELDVRMKLKQQRWEAERMEVKRQLVEHHHRLELERRQLEERRLLEEQEMALQRSVQAEHNKERIDYRKEQFQLKLQQQQDRKQREQERQESIERMLDSIRKQVQVRVDSDPNRIHLPTIASRTAKCAVDRKSMVSYYYYMAYYSLKSL